MTSDEVLGQGEGAHPWPARAPAPEVCRQLFLDDFIARVLIDEAGTVLHANVAAASLIGRIPEEVVGRSVLDLVAPGETDTALAALAEMGEPELRTGGIPIVFAAQHADGHAVPLEIGALDLLDEERHGMISIRLRRFDREHSLQVFLESLAAGGDLDVLLDAALGHADHVLVDTAPALLHGDGRWISHRVPEALVRASADPTPAGSLPWDAAARGERCVVEVDQLPEPLARAARAGGFASCWAEPVFARDERVAIASLVMWRVWGGPPFIGAQHAVERLVRTISLAFLHQRAVDRLRTAARTDHLTGLANRAEMFAALDRALGDDRHGDVGLLYVDLDGFKVINDGHGHGAGDRVLVTVADRIRSTLRTGDVAARIGGDEFVVLCPGATAAVLEAVADRLVGALSEPVDVGDEHLDLGVSVGVARTTAARCSPDALLEAADAALYRAKRAGGCRWAGADGDRV